MSVKYYAYFISPYGDVIPLSSDRHIHEIINNADKFGLTKDEIEKVYEKHGEALNSEGNAREEIISDLIKKGWARIRYIRNRDSYTIQIFDLDNRQKENIYDWATLVIGDNESNRYTGVVIMEIKPNGDTKHGTLNDIVKFKLFEEMKKINIIGINRANK
jgi:hypothetical protein